MPAPTAVKKAPEAPPLNDIEIAETTDAPVLDLSEALSFAGDAAAEAAVTAVEPVEPTENVLMEVDDELRPHFTAAKDSDVAVRREQRKIPVPPHRMTPLKASWNKIYTPLVEKLRLQVRMNTHTKAVELRTSSKTTEVDALQKGEDFVRAFMMGFDVEDAAAILRLDGIYIQTFEIKDVKSLEGDHLSRAVGRIVGKDGRTKYTIENTTKTRIVIAGGSKIHILGGFKQIGIARETIVSLILGKPPGKVYDNMRVISARLKERF